jgi:hypothetical protein
MKIPKDNCQKNWQKYWMWKYRKIIVNKKLTEILNVKIPKDKHQKNWQEYWMWKYQKISIKKIDRNIEFVDIIYSLPLYEKINNVPFHCLKNNFIRQKFLHYYIHTLFIYTFTIGILTVDLFLFSFLCNIIIVIRKLNNRPVHHSYRLVPYHYYSATQRRKKTNRLSKRLLWKCI